MGRSTVHYADNATNNILKRLHNKLRPAGTPVQRVEYIIELLLLRIFEVKLKHDPEFKKLRGLFTGKNDDLLFSALANQPNDQILPTLNSRFFPFYSNILGELRKVSDENPTTKVKDQLVLVEEVFGNSNFTNNVNSGNLREVVGLVAELDEDRLLKTDLLGDAIESALSETGGTKDIGLHRTPDHIRQFMVGLVMPTFTDLIFDPTCGTGGFLFDASEYVIESVRKSGAWPGPKSHPELAAWFKEYFSQQKVKMPSHEVSTDFDRQGVAGIEYLGMIRKMAAINFYIRGLNPANIHQGDALALFKKEFFPESKTAILANPPFGAERDQEAYPDVWAEYPKESETTILFVKLMLETLKKTGRCAVIVSEGFMTWDQNSARALRKALLDDTDLKAIIRLPQGVFVSKNGQGPPTSILCFEKGSRTGHVWFYNVTNDGYTMGTNRKQIPGCQLVEALDLFHRYIRHGKLPPAGRHSFTVPAEWIKTLDPRLKERIHTETRAELTEKAEQERAKLAESLTNRQKDGKLTAEQVADRLAQHAEVWQHRIHNEIGKRIDRAHLYSFNLPNYRSNLTAEQIEAWHSRVKVVAERTQLDLRYDKLKKASPAELDDLLTQLDPHNALELDIARQFLSNLDATAFAAHPHLKTLSDIIATQQKWPRVKLKELIEPRYDKIRKSDYDGTLPIVEKIAFDDGRLYFRDERKTGMDLYRAEAGDLVTSKINIHQGAVAIAPCPLVASTHYQIYRVHTEDVNPRFLVNMLRSQHFLSQLNEQKSKGIKNEQGADFFGEFELPLPPLEEQLSSVARVERSEELIRGCTLTRDRLDLAFPVNPDWPKQKIGEVVRINNGGVLTNFTEGGKTACVKVSDMNLPENEWAIVTSSHWTDDPPHEVVPTDSIVFPKRGAAIATNKKRITRIPCAIDNNCMALIVTDKRVLPDFLYAFLLSFDLTSISKSAGIPLINNGDISQVGFPMPPQDIQEQVVRRLQAKLKLRDELRGLRQEAEDSIKVMLNSIWEH
jgi:type I restriction-modification system DNA methylase subunit/restriction endonuclease S subunit